jgi:hypothetical protein
MNTQELAERIIQDLQGTKTRNCLVCGSFTAISVAAVKRQLDLALAESKVPTQNNHPVKVPAVPPKTANVFCYGCWDTGWTDMGCPCPCGKPGVVP